MKIPGFPDIPFADRVDIFPSEWVEAGKPLLIADPGKVPELLAHPLDVIALQYHRDPTARLDAVLEWVTARIGKHAEIVNRKIDRML